MKTKYFNIGVILLLVICSFSCEKFLTKENPNALTDDTFWETEDDFTSGIASIYSATLKEAVFNARGWEMMNGRSDEVRSEWPTNTLAAYACFIADPNLMYIYMRYSFFYKGIVRANHLMKMLDEKGAFLGEEKINQLKAEAHFLRGFYHFYLLQDYGYIAYVDEPYYDMESMLKNIRQMPQDSVFPKIIEDFKFAAKYLPEEWSSQFKGRATKGSALAFLGLTHLNYMNFQEAADALGELIGTDPTAPSVVGGYQLMPEYADLWSPGNYDNNIESVFEIQFGFQGGPSLWTYDNPEASLANYLAKASVYPEQAWINMILYFHQEEPRDKVNEWAWAEWFRDPYKKYMDHSSIAVEDVYDPRLTGGVFFKWSEAGKQGLGYGERVFTTGGEGKESWSTNASGLRKYADYWLPNQPEQSDKNFPLMRYAEVLLLKAEAENELGQPIEALKYIDVVRNRAKLPKIREQHDGANWTQEMVRHEIESQRYKELFCEGKRWYDMQRWGHNPNFVYNVKDTLTAHDWPLFRESKRGLHAYNYVVGRDEYFPLPFKAITANSNLKQNYNQEEFLSKKFR